MYLKIQQVGHPVLRKTARVLSHKEIYGTEIQELIESMRETMYQAPGVGLAAPQIGLSLQLIVIEDREIYHQKMTTEQLQARDRHPVPFQVIINPTLTVDDTVQAEFHEGCLSFAGFVGVVPRALNVTVKALNEKADPIVIHAKGWYARILQHEMDHLNGKLCIDHTHIHTLTTIENYTTYHV